MLFESNVALWPCRAAGMAVVAAQVLLLEVHSSAVASVVVPFEPPVTSTWPWLTSAAGSAVAVCPCRALVIVAAVPQLPDPLAALNCTDVFKTVVPLTPPATSTLPFESAVAVCPSRAVDCAVRLVHVDVPSKSCTFVTDVPPP